MIRNLYIIGLVLGCMGLPVQAKGTIPTPSNPPAPVKSAKVASKDAAKPSAPTVTEDKSRSAVASVTTAKPEKAKTTIAKTPEVTLPVSHSTLHTSHGSVAVSNMRTSASGRPAAGEHLARVTAYWAGEGDYYTGRCLSSTGIHLHDGHCAVDPRIIPYGSVVDISGVGKYLAVDTGSAVISREAAREAAHTAEERNALVIDLFFESRRDGERFAANGPKYAAISWTSPTSTATTAMEIHTQVAEESAE